MFKKVDIPVGLHSAHEGALTESQITGLLLNMSHYKCSSCSTPHELFGSPKNFLKAASDLDLPVLGQFFHQRKIRKLTRFKVSYHWFHRSVMEEMLDGRSWSKEGQKGTR